MTQRLYALLLGWYVWLYPRTPEGRAVYGARLDAIREDSGR